jgi:hypothetical protein
MLPIVCTLSSVAVTVALGEPLIGGVLIGLVVGVLGGLALYLAVRFKIVDEDALRRKQAPGRQPSMKSLVQYVAVMLVAAVVSGIWWGLGPVGWLVWIPTAALLGVFLAWGLSNSSGSGR